MNKPEPKLFDYNKACKDKVKNLKEEGWYRTFIDILRKKDEFPKAIRWNDKGILKEITVWCSNDYLGMGQHPKVVEAMHKAIDETGTGAGGTWNIGGNTWYIVDLESELAWLHQKERGLVGSSCYVANEFTLQTLPQVLGPDTVYFSDSSNHASLIHGMKNS